MLFLLHEPCLAQLTFQLAQDLLMAKALPPELDESVYLLITLHNLDTLPPLPVVLIDEHLYEAANVWYAA